MEKQIELLREELSAEELAYFDQLAPSYQKNFVRHAFSPKTEKTRLKNLEEVKEAMQFNCKNIFDYKKKKNPRPENSDQLSEMEKMNLYFQKIENPEFRRVFINLYDELAQVDPSLVKIYAWNQPMIKYNETFIMALSAAKNHLSIGLDARALELFSEQLSDNDFELMKKGAKIKYTAEINFDLLKEIVLYTITIKQDAKGFWN